MKKNNRVQTICIICFVVVALMCVLPFILLVISSFTDETVLIKNGYSYFPEKLSLEAYKYLLNQAGMIGRSYAVTIFITAIGTLVGIMISSMMAYVLTRQELKFHKVLMFIVIFSILFNGGLVPTYLVYTKIFHIKNTIFGLLLPKLLVNGFNILLIRNYFISNIPNSIIESAKLDGAKEFKIYYKIILPISLPIMATIGLIIGLSYWNDWFNGLIYLTDRKLFSIQVVLNQIISNIQFLATSDIVDMATTTKTIPVTSVRMAIALIAILPMLVLFSIFQKSFVKGITAGAVKG